MADDVDTRVYHCTDKVSCLIAAEVIRIGSGISGELLLKWRRVTNHEEDNR